MAETINKQTKVIPRKLVTQTFIEESALFGLISWWRLDKQETIDEELHIETSKVPEKVKLNGVEYVPKS